MKLYLETMVGLCRSLPLGPLDPGGRESARVTLEQVYVELDAQPFRALTFEKQPGEARSVLAHVTPQSRLVILGDPGSGKSTFLRFLALRLAQAWLQPTGEWLNYLKWPVYLGGEREWATVLSKRHEEEKKPLGYMTSLTLPLIPVMVTLREFAAADFDPASPLALWRFISADLERRGLGETLPALRSQLLSGQGILLLDGTDEVPAQRRAEVWQALGALNGGGFNHCPWLATCRVLSYVEAEAAGAGATGRVTLAPLNPGQVEGFITTWYQALVDNGEKSPAQAESLSRQLRQAAARPLRELAQNPMLLTIMALVQTYYGTLPDERAKLYQACVETLLLRWQQSKEAAATGLPRSLAELGLRQEVIEPLLWEIGWTAHQEQAGQGGVADISEETVMALAKKHLGDYAKAQAFVEYTERRAHLLLGRGGIEGPRFTFPHRTFQEYLAGCHLANERRFGKKAAPLAAAGAPWREVLLLAAGALVFNQKVARNLFDALEDILPGQQPQPGDTSGWQRVWRAGEMLALAGPAAALADEEVGAGLLDRIRDDLAALLHTGQLTPPERAEAGRVLAVLGDPRPGVGLTAEGLPDIVWCPVEAGPFIMGSDEGGNEKPAHQVTLPAFEISQYPITNTQFGAFVSAGGYQQARYWNEAQNAGYWKDGQFKGDYDNSPKSGPIDFGLPFNLANHPVVGVSWYESLAFCHWLSEQVGYLVRLPTEAEWEKAARGIDARRYPWGNQGEPADHCNVIEARIGTTSTVGIFPSGVSPCGAWDMSGNVWEWCSTTYKSYPFKVQDEWQRVYLNRTGVPRILRGGAFYFISDDMRCAARDRLNPGDWFNHFGFRVLRPLISG